MTSGVCQPVARSLGQWSSALHASIQPSSYTFSSSSSAAWMCLEHPTRDLIAMFSSVSAWFVQEQRTPPWRCSAGGPSGRGVHLYAGLGYTVCYACALSVNRPRTLSGFCVCHHLVLSAPLEFPFKQSLQVEFSWTAWPLGCLLCPSSLSSTWRFDKLPYVFKSHIMPTKGMDITIFQNFLKEADIFLVSVYQCLISVVTRSHVPFGYKVKGENELNTRLTEVY